MLITLSICAKLPGGHQDPSHQLRSTWEKHAFHRVFCEGGPRGAGGDVPANLESKSSHGQAAILYSRNANVNSTFTVREHILIGNYIKREVKGTQHRGVYFNL